MAELLTLILWLLALALVLLAALLVTPTLVFVRVATSPRLTWNVHVRLLGGLAPRIALRDAATSRRSKSTTRSRKQGPRRKTRSGRSHVMSAVPRLVADVLGAIRLRSLRMDCDFGLDDPADTGRIAGLLMPLQYADILPANVQLAVRPDFTQRRFTGELVASLSVTLAAFVPAVLRFAWRGLGPAR